MKNTLLTLSIFLYSTFAFAQIDYYKDLDSNRRCQELKTELFEYLNNGFTPRTYDQAYNFMADFDLRKVGNETFIWDIYSYNPDGPQPYTYKPGNKCGGSGGDSGYNKEGDCWNREHVMPSSWFSAGDPMYGDHINLLPTDGFVNNKRSSLPYGNVTNVSWTSKNGSKLGTGTIPILTGNYFEPIDEFKGDVARILLYMSVKYQDKFNSWTGFDFIRVKGSDPLKGFRDEYLQVLIAWHELDPPSQKERDRNDKIQNRQDNRNPFVDFPQFVDYIWKTENCKPVGVKNYEQNKINLYPNPAQNEISLGDNSAKGQLYYITDISGKTVLNGVFNQPRISVANLDNGTYFLFLTEYDLASYSKFIIAR